MFKLYYPWLNAFNVGPLSNERANYKSDPGWSEPVFYVIYVAM